MKTTKIAFVATVMLAILKLTHTIDWHWILILLPMVLSIVLDIGSFVWDFYSKKKWQIGLSIAYDVGSFAWNFYNKKKKNLTPQELKKGVYGGIYDAEVESCASFVIRSGKKEAAQAAMKLLEAIPDAYQRQSHLYESIYGEKPPVE